MPNDSPTYAVPQTATQIDVPPVASVFVLNSSEGLGDNPAIGAGVIVDNNDGVSFDPQSGLLIPPGRSVEIPLIDPSTDGPLGLWAIADGPNATITIHLV